MIRAGTFNESDSHSMKTIFRLIKLCIFLGVLGLIFHNFTARFLLAAGLRYYLGTPVEVSAAKVDFLNTQILFKGIQIKNPSGFPEGALAKIPEIFVDFEISSLLDGRFYFDEISIHFEELKVVRIPDGRINLLALRALENQEERKNEKRNGKSPRRSTFSEFRLTLRQVIFTDFSRQIPHQKSFDFKIEQAIYRNLDTVKDVLAIIAWESIKRIGIK